MECIKQPKVENVTMLDRYNPKSSSQGTLYLTATHLIFVDPDGKKETWILHMHIASVDKLPLTTTGCPLLVRCKTFLSVTFVVPRERDCHEIFTTLEKLSKPSNLEELYCFRYKENIPKQTGWTFFDLQSEFSKMGVPNDQWCLTNLNKEYELCDTYPKHLYVPRNVSTTVLMGSSRFRSKGRLPVLTYLHKNKAAICRCSQPLSGFSARCVEDEQMLNCILRSNPNSSFMYVVDTRPKLNALANRAAGKGYENEAFYENIKFHFLGIENIHVMRNSLAKIVETCELKNPTMSAFLSNLESSGWLKHIKAILDTSSFIAHAVNDGISVVVHCSDGWDRTAQVCSLASVLIDPYYRTIPGFQSLIEKDWLGFGFKFTERCGIIQNDVKEISPVFTQFLDATWQLTQQFPLSFEFNKRFLLTLHDHVHSCQYGTFIGNCEKDRIDLKLSERTYSFWGNIANHMNEYTNPIYDQDACPSLIVPDLSPQNIKFWRGMYCRFESGVHPREPLSDLIAVTCDHSTSLREHIKFLSEKLASVKESIASLANKNKAVQNLVTKKYSSSKELDSAIDYPDPTTEKKGSSLDGESQGLQNLMADLNSVAVDWKSLRNIKECSCLAPFDSFSRKYHCWKCGDVFCTRCIDGRALLPGHLARKAVPVCRPCQEKASKANATTE